MVFKRNSFLTDWLASMDQSKRYDDQIRISLCMNLAYSYQKYKLSVCNPKICRNISEFAFHVRNIYTGTHTRI